ncbi:thioredoxin domain-containing protein [Isoptericola sp. b441]|uniref:Thioredoxin domain-containing protein n=1 Tax=Actinotalea lenta TaxID=3064654 RepID=A0ABT9D7V8_9CELL|nr:thioredoxin domain-containing protein [Isoptericola sp. b441]MDO8106329.1 thioredoxin domain-containing protein [Isoptericola sp. b441]
MPTVDLTAETFDSTIRDNPIVLVDFWAPWCAPCHMFDPVYATASARHDGIVFGKVDTDSQRELAIGLGIVSIPTLMAFRDGKRVKTAADALPPRALEKFIADVRSIDMATFGRDPIDDIPDLDM